MLAMRTLLTAKRLWDGSGFLENPVVIVEDGHIDTITVRGACEAAPGERVMDLAGATLAPALVDVHTHGAAGHDAMEATPEALGAICAFWAKHGTGSFLATTVTAPLDATLHALEGLAKWMAREPQPGQAQMLGIHLEGPFLSHAKRGAHPSEYLLKPEIGTFDRLCEAAEGRVRLMTLAPELEGATELAAHATARGVCISIGHSNATASETRAAIQAGAASATHTFNAMRPLDHHEPGILGTVLTDDSLYAELICDGIHNEPEMARLWWRAKGPERGILITDALSAAGMPDGAYQLGGQTVQVTAGRALLPGDVLAGSVLTLNRAVVNFMRFTGAGLEEALCLATANPAAMVGLKGVGRLAVGGPADLIAVDQEGRLIASFVRGEQAFYSGSPIGAEGNH